MRRFDLVDVFGDGTLSGNPLAVVHDAEGLDTETMQQITRWLNLSETTFLLPPTDGADYRVRIFTLARELDFAGHPTLGTAHAWLAASGAAAGHSRVQECGAGDVPLHSVDGRLAFAAPPLVRSGPVADDDLERFVDAFDLDRDQVVDAAWVDNGPGWAALLLRDVDDVLSVVPPPSHPEELDVGFVALRPDTDDCAIEVRALFSDDRGGIIEDPVTGSLNASVAQWLLSSGRLDAPYVAGQGTAVGRRGRVHISQDDDGTVWVGGNTTTVASGHMDV
ncbi:MAG: PhzF family phenazine biosynthesis protein [Nitriliruptorales bacterium]|nr:PhzF family phenazine biosynthesis protein [Nitriliruptorales bacterium]